MAKRKTPSKGKKKSSKKGSAERSTVSRLGSVLSFRWLKKMIHSQFRSWELLDLWILKRNWVSLFQ